MPLLEAIFKTIGIIADCYAFGQLIRQMFTVIKGFKMKAILSNSYSKMLLFTGIFTLIVFILPWDEIHIGKQTVKIVYRDTSKSSVDTNRKLPNKPKEKPTGVLAQKEKKHSEKSKSKPPRKDTTKGDQYNLQGATLNGSAVGKNPTVNNYNGTKPQRHFEQSLEEKINQIGTKSDTIVVNFDAQDAEQKNFAIEIYHSLKNKGYRVGWLQHWYQDPPQSLNGEAGAVIKDANNAINIIIYPEK